MVAQGFGGIGSEKINHPFATPGTKGVLARIEINHPFATPGAKGVLARIEFGQHEQHLMVQGQPVHVRGQLHGAVQMPVFFRQEVQRGDFGLVHHVQGVGGTDQGADPAALAGFGIGLNIQAQTPQPLQALGSASIFMAKRSHGTPLGGFLKILKYLLASAGTSSGVTRQKMAASGQEATTGRKRSQGTFLPSMTGLIMRR